MAAVNTAAIQTAIRNVLDGTFDGVRDIAANTYQEGQAQSVKGLTLVTPTFGVNILGSAPSEAAPLSNSASNSIEVLELMVSLEYVLPPLVMIDDRYATQATITNNANLAVQALTMPGNLDDDGAAIPVATNIVSGLLTGPGGIGRPTVTFSQDWAALTARTEISASAVVVVTQPTS